MMKNRLGFARRLVGLLAMLVVATAWPQASFPVDEKVQVAGSVDGQQHPNGRYVFEQETFGGNGRTCRTCHSKETGTISVADVAERINDPTDPLFLQDGLDDDGIGTTRIRTHATIRMTIPLPPGITLADDPGATSVKVNRGSPTTRNTPALDPVLLADGRAPTILDQALAAIHDHFQSARTPTAAELASLVEFEQTHPSFFSSNALKQFAKGAPPPQLPEGRTAAEKRGRRFLVDVPFNPPAKDGACALCHSGPMLNETNLSQEAFGIPQGFRFIDTGVTLVNAPNNPILTFIIDDGVNPAQAVSTPDLGLLLNPNPALPPPELFPRALLPNLFKIPTLWGISQTAPYFHDNGAKTLRDAVHHYVRFFNFPCDVDPVGSCTLGGLIELTEDDVDDIVAYLKLL